ncbi:hypothetical protein [Stenomitos frigidus]|uniref:Uncharacterized protein n=1 Tax=Stenomitos frigidus ULC18 TaxID=2107698 RepID=A0A2T1EFB7_9CYAN|nr:hypothetical protein [Stenomitos frigidus]PSB31398.1 hypothetical protein C7B82_07435 [Stenomitos frigidus ULC18]
MVDPELMQKLQGVSIEDRILVIEAILQTVKQDMQQGTSPKPEPNHRPAFGFMQDTGAILGDVIAPVLPETAWEVLQ